jgi:pimeloyl-ACP methyl ester carboxylesterase
MRTGTAHRKAVILPSPRNPRNGERLRSATALCILILLVAASTGMTQETRSAPQARTAMNRAVLDGIELEYEVRGAGEPVVLVHAGVLAGWFKPLMDEPALSRRYRLVRYHRIGYAGSSRIAGPVSLGDQAGHLRALMQHLGIERAHFVGHSSSGNIVLQAALDAPHVVHSLALLEPALLGVPSGPQVAKAVLAPAVERYRAGDKAGAVETFMQGVTGPAYRAALEKALPGAFEQAVADADTFFGQELPALRQWSFSREDARRITQPVLAVLGAKSDDVRPAGEEASRVFRERHELLLAWLPNVEPFILPDATHLLHVENPRGMADGLASFFARHALSVK